MKQNLATYLTQVTIIDFKITIGGNVVEKQNKKNLSSFKSEDWVP